MFKAFSLYSIPSLVQSFFSFIVIIPITTYFLEPYDFGIFAILLLGSSFVLPLATSGCAWVLGSNYYKNSNDENKKLIFNSLVFDFLLMTFWCLFFYHISEILLNFILEFNKEYHLYFSLILLSIWSGVFWPLISTLLVMQEKPAIHISIEVFKWIINVTTVITCLTIFKVGLLSLILGPLVSNMVFLVIEFSILISQSKIVIEKKFLKEIVNVGLPSIPGNITDILNQMSARFFIQQWLSTSSTGILYHSQSYANIFRNLNKAYEKFFSPYALKEFSKNNKLQFEIVELTTIMKLYFRFLIIGGILTSIFSYDIVDLITHGKFIDAAPLIPIWYLYLFSLFYGYVYSQYLVALKRVKILAYTQIFIPLVSILFVALSSYFFGLLGAVGSIVFSNFLLQIFRKIYACKFGCPIKIDNFFWIGISIHILFYLFSLFTNYHLIIKILIVLMFLFYSLNLFKSNWNILFKK